MDEDIKTCYPAKIISFDPVTQLARCKLSVEDYFTGVNYSYRKQAAALLIDVPVHTLQGGGWVITFPIKAGDDCLVMFAQKGYDHWLYSGAQETGLVDGIPTGEHYREFSIRDAICLVGIRPIPSAITEYSPDDVDIRNASKTQRVSLKANGDIEFQTDADVYTNAKNITSTAETVNVIAKDVNVDSDNTIIKAKTAKIDCPLTEFTGSIKVAGNAIIGGGITMGGGAKTGVCRINGTIIATGTGTFDGDVIAAGKSVSTHTHTGNMGNPTSPPL